MMRKNEKAILCQDVFLYYILIQKRMENKLRLKKCNPATIRFNGNYHPFPDLTANDSEDTAKNMLFELSDHENIIEPLISPLHIQKNSKINDWFNIEIKTVDESTTPSFKQLKLQFKSLHLSKTFDPKKRTKTSHRQTNELSVIPHLKSYLQKLQSPRKIEGDKRERKLELNTVKIDDSFYANQQRATTASPCIKRPNTKKSRTIVYKKMTIEKNKNYLRKQKTNFFQFQEVSEKIELIKEARKNRTLRNLLL